jgi:hypothetical protein
VNITPASELHPYRSYLETRLTYCPDAANSHLTNAFWYIDGGDVLAGDPTSTSIKTKGFVKRWERQKGREITVIRASTRRYIHLAISAVGCALADKFDQSQGRFLRHELGPGYKGDF